MNRKTKSKHQVACFKKPEVAGTKNRYVYFLKNGDVYRALKNNKFVATSKRSRSKPSTVKDVKVCADSIVNKKSKKVHTKMGA